MDKEFVKTQIREAFSTFRYPGDWCLQGGYEGDEPFLVSEAFAGKDDWTKLEPDFLDSAPNGFGSALSFFSDEAFHFYLPAYLTADIDGRLKRVTPVFHLTYRLEDEHRNERVNEQRYGERTWLDEAIYKFAVFNRREAAAIVSYLAIKRETDPFDQTAIDQALKNYWIDRVQFLSNAT